MFVQCCRCSSCPALCLALLVAAAFRARCALGARRGTGDTALAFCCAAAASSARRAFDVGRGAGALVRALAARRASAPPRAVGRRGLGVRRRVALPILPSAMRPLFFVLWGVAVSAVAHAPHSTPSFRLQLFLFLANK